MKCEFVAENLSAYLDQELPVEEMNQIENHLQECAECRQELTEMQSTIALLASLDEVIPPASFRRELRTKLEKSAKRKGFSLDFLMKKIMGRSVFAPVAVAMILLIIAVPFIFENSRLRLGMSQKAAESSAPAYNMAGDYAVENEALTGKAFTADGLKAQQGLVAGGSGSQARDMAGSVSPTATAKDSEAVQAEIFNKEISQYERKIIKNADLELHVDSYDQAVADIKKQVGSLGGYIANESLYSRNAQDSPRGSIVIRLPFQQFDSFLSGLEGLGKVENRNIYTQDVTEEFVDIESRLKVLRNKEERLLTILQKSGQLADILAVENELANTRAELESLEGRLRYLSNRVDYSTITVYLVQVVVPTQTISAGGLEGVLTQAREAFILTINNLLYALGKLVVFLGAALPVLIIIGVIIFVLRKRVGKKSVQ